MGFFDLTPRNMNEWFLSLNSRGFVSENKHGNSTDFQCVSSDSVNAVFLDFMRNKRGPGIEP